MIRKQIYITERQNQYLEKEAHRLRLRVAEILRRILDEHIDIHEKDYDTENHN